MKKSFYFSLLIISFVFNGCYSFSGNAIPPHIQSIFIPVFNDDSRSGIPRLRESLTTRLTDKIQNQSSLIIASSKTTANAVLEATVSGYVDAPSALGGTNERATQNRITITVTASFRDEVEKKWLFQKKTFTAFKDYPVGNAAQQRTAIDDSAEQLAEIILNQMLSGW
ncbi:MAG: LptE family protein [Chloroherpetonaceae bacterium]|nr:LptE family protein [Chloroherpetonaceae bacterium]